MPMREGKKFSGQPVLSQILDVIPKEVVSRSARKHQANRYYKKLPLRVHLVSLLYGVFSYCNGLRELSEGLLACEGKLSHLGMDRVPQGAHFLTPTANVVIGSLKRSIRSF